MIQYPFQFCAALFPNPLPPALRCLNLDERKEGMNMIPSILAILSSQKSRFRLPRQV
jgi:hypothetical protein